MTAKKTSKQAARNIRSSIDDTKDGGPKAGSQANRALSTLKARKPKKK